MKAYGDSHMQALGPRLQRAGVVDQVVANPGWTLKRTLGEGLLAGVSGDVLLEFGTNELFNGQAWQHPSTQFANAVGFSDYLGVAAELLKGSRVVLVGPPSLDHGQLGDLAVQWDELAKARATELGWRFISSLEVTQGTWRYAGPGDSGIHQTEAGYSAWADHIAQALQVAAGKPWVITEHQLYRAVKELSREKAAALIAPVRLMLVEAGAVTPLRAAHLLGQVAHESGGLRLLHEEWGPSAAQLAYEPPSRVARMLGNTQPGDGYLYRGCGWVQLTGRGNYQRAGLALGLPLEAQPDLAAQVEVAARVAAWYWRTHGCSELADRDDLEGVTRRINGGENHLEMRRARLVHAKAALGVSPSPASP